MRGRMLALLSISVCLLLANQIALAEPHPPFQKPPPCSFPCGPGGSPGCEFSYCPQTYPDFMETSRWCAARHENILCENDICYYSPGLDEACCTVQSDCQGCTGLVEQSAEFSTCS